MTTKADFRLMVLWHLTVLPESDTEVPAEQARKVDRWIDAGRSLLLEKGLCWWDEDDIPEAVTIPLSQYIAGLSCSAFGKRGKGFEQQVDAARAAIAGLKSSDQHDEIRAEYF